MQKQSTRNDLGILGVRLLLEILQLLLQVWYGTDKPYYISVVLSHRWYTVVHSSYSMVATPTAENPFHIPSIPPLLLCYCSDTADNIQYALHCYSRTPKAVVTTTTIATIRCQATAAALPSSTGEVLGVSVGEATGEAVVDAIVGAVVGGGKHTMGIS